VNSLVNGFVWSAAPVSVHHFSFSMGDGGGVLAGTAPAEGEEGPGGNGLSSNDTQFESAAQSVPKNLLSTFFADTITWLVLVFTELKNGLVFMHALL
jgi:hypothetical protein